MDEKEKRTFKTPGISFSLKRRRVLIYKSTIQAIEAKENIRFLFNMKKNCLAIQACSQIDPDSFRVPEITEQNKQFEISSLQLLKLIWKCCKWEDDKTYRVIGKVYPDYRIVEFDLNNSEIIAEDQFVDPDI